MFRIYISQLPEELQITDDNLHVVLVCPSPAAADADLRATKTLTTYSLDHEEAGDCPAAKVYEYQAGAKYKKYGVTRNVMLCDGIAIAVGLNGDMQLWDTSSCDYEGNLCDDTSVKEKRNPSLHNHHGMPIKDAVVSCDGRYMVCGGVDSVATLWDLDSEAVLRSYKGHTAEVKSRVFTTELQRSHSRGKEMNIYYRVTKFMMYFTMAKN